MDNIKVAVRLRPFNKREVFYGYYGFISNIYSDFKSVFILYYKQLEIGSVQVVFVNGKQIQLKAAHNKEK